MRPLATLSAFAAFGYCTGYFLHPAAAAQDQSFARVFYCENDAGRAELYLAGSAMTRDGKPQLALGNKTAQGYLAFDFTPVGKNKTLDAVSVRMDSTGSALEITLMERGSNAMMPLAGGPVKFSQRLAEEMQCRPFNKN
jgi:hypothetical protein